MNRRTLVKAIAAHTDNDHKSVDSIVQGFTEVVTAAVSKGEPVSIPGFVKFAKVERSARWGRNPATGERIRIKASKRARVTALKALKDAVATPSAAPKVGKGVLEGTAIPRSIAAKKAARSKTVAKKRAAPARARATSKPRATSKARTATKARRTTKKRATRR